MFLRGELERLSSQIVEFLDNQLLSSPELPDLANKSGEDHDKFKYLMNKLTILYRLTETLCTEDLMDYCL